MADHPINVRLSRSDLARADQASALRYQLARASGVKDRLIDTSRSGNQSDLPGLKAAMGRRTHGDTKRQGECSYED